MKLMRMTFEVMTIIGCWRPASWSTLPKRFIYDTYTIVIFVLVHLMTLSQFMDLLLNVENADELSDNFYMFLTMFVSCFKMCSLLGNRNNIALLMNEFTEGSFLPVDEEEIGLQKKFDDTLRSNTVWYTILVESTITIMAAVSLFSNFTVRKLVFRAWLPYNYSSNLLFGLNYIHQNIGLAYGSLLHVACDSLISGLLIHICCQLEFLGCRLRNIRGNEKFFLKKCIVHHEQIYRFANRLNECFKLTILVQFLVSMLVICFNMYKLAKSKGISPMFLQMIAYMMCMLTQVFFYCWYGNEAKLKSREVSDAVFEMNWATLDNDARTIVLTIMQRTKAPITITSAHIVTMNLETFVSVLKTSYSAYNVLQKA